MWNSKTNTFNNSNETFDRQGPPWNTLPSQSPGFCVKSRPREQYNIPSFIEEINKQADIIETLRRKNKELEEENFKLKQ